MELSLLLAITTDSSYHTQGKQRSDIILNKDMQTETSYGKSRTSYVD